MAESTNSITPKELKDIIDSGAKLELLDVRNFDEFEQMRLPSARLIPLPQLSLRFEEIDKSKPIYVFCKGDPRSKKAQATLKELGIKATFMVGGLNAWHKAELPVIQGPCKKSFSIDQQTRIAIGCLVLLGLIVPQLWWLSWFVAIMLVIAGLTNTCMLMNMLEAMPWNK